MERCGSKESVVIAHSLIATMTILEITNLHLNVTETDLRRLFTPFGEIASIEIVRDRLNNRSKGKAIIKMPVEKEAKQATLSLNGNRVAGKSISITMVPIINEDEKNSGLL